MIGENSTGDEVTSRLESYSLVLSLSSLILSAVFGCGGSLAMFTALCVSKSTRKLRYTLFASVLISNVLFACIWVPMEAYQLLNYYNYGRVADDVKFTVHSLYLLLLTVNVSSIILICIKNLTFIIRRNRKALQQKVIFAILVGSWILGFILATAYGVLSECKEEYLDQESFHLMMNTPSYQFKISLFTIYTLLLLVLLVGLLASARLRSLEGEEPSEDSDTQGEMSACLPTIEEPQPDSPLDKDAKKQDQTKGSSPRDDKKMICVQETPAKKEEDRFDISPLPSTKRKSSLGVNLGALLNRRRHTICQIGNTGTSTDPQAKAMQYNYVRKFSVDVVALQAQLENPKIHGGDFPFQSQQSLGCQSKKDINGSLIKDSKTSLPSIQELENEGAFEMANQLPNLTFLSEQFEKRKSSVQRHFQERVRGIRFCVLLVVTYLCCTFPLYITEMLHAIISLTPYINVITCTTSLSLVQIIIYPYIFLCMDSTVNKVTHKLFSDLRYSWLQRRDNSGKPGITVSEPNTTETTATQV